MSLTTITEHDDRILNSEQDGDRYTARCTMRLKLATDGHPPLSVPMRYDAIRDASGQRRVVTHLDSAAIPPIAMATLRRAVENYLASSYDIRPDAWAGPT